MDVYLQVYYINSPFNTHNTLEGIILECITFTITIAVVNRSYI